MSDSELIKSINVNVNILVYICLFIIIFCCLMSSINAITLSSMYPNDSLTYEPPSIICVNGKCKYIKNTEEHFSNDELFSYKKQEVANYISIPLLAPFDEFKNPTNLLFGKANVYINTSDDNLYYRLEIYSNLLVLDGNIYDVAKSGIVDQKYLVYLLNDKLGKKKLIGNLYKDGDGIYKLKKTFKDNIDELVSYNKINIVYTLDNKEQIVLEGSVN